MEVIATVAADVLAGRPPRHGRIVSREEKPAPPQGGPGTELAAILKGLGVEQCLPCQGRAKRMDEWGIEGCRANRAAIVGWMKEGLSRQGVNVALWAAALAVRSGLAFRLNLLDPLGSLVDEAIRRAE